MNQESSSKPLHPCWADFYQLFQIEIALIRCKTSFFILQWKSDQPGRVGGGVSWATLSFVNQISIKKFPLALILRPPAIGTIFNFFFYSLPPNSLEYQRSVAANRAAPSGCGWESRALQPGCFSDSVSEWAEARRSDVSMVTGLIHLGVFHHEWLKTSASSLWLWHVYFMIQG